MFAVVANTWQESYNTTNTLWRQLSDNVSEYNLWTWGTLVAHLWVFWGLNAFFLFVDLNQYPKFMLKYKIQDGKNQPLDPKKFRSAVVRALFNQVLILIFSMISFDAAKWRGIGFGEPLPSLQTIILSMAFFGVIEEILFYYSHRLLHYGVLYKYIHKLHHEWQAPIGITAIYANPIEHLVSNLIPIFVGPFLLGSHLLTIWLWYSLAIFVTIHSHSGYHLPFMPSAEFHDYHHLKFNQNYGVLGFLDWLHGTDGEFRNKIQFKRHLTFFSTKSVKELYPEEPTKKDK